MSNLEMAISNRQLTREESRVMQHWVCHIGAMMPGTIDFGGHSLGKDGAEYSFLVGALARAFAIRGISVAETGAVSGLPSIEAQKKDLYLPATEAATFPVAV